MAAKKQAPESPANQDDLSTMRRMICLLLTLAAAGCGSTSTPVHTPAGAAAPRATSRTPQPWPEIFLRPGTMAICESLPDSDAQLVHLYAKHGREEVVPRIESIDQDRMLLKSASLNRAVLLSSIALVVIDDGVLSGVEIPDARTPTLLSGLAVGDWCTFAPRVIVSENGSKFGPRRIPYHLRKSSEPVPRRGLRNVQVAFKIHSLCPDCVLFRRWSSSHGEPLEADRSLYLFPASWIVAVDTK